MPFVISIPYFQNSLNFSTALRPQLKCHLLQKAFYDSHPQSLSTPFHVILCFFLSHHLSDYKVIVYLPGL